MDCGQHIIRIARIYKNRRYPFKDQLTRTVFATALPKVVIMAAADMGGDFCVRGGVRAAGLFSFALLLLLVVADRLPYAVADLRRPRFYFFLWILWPLSLFLSPSPAPLGPGLYILYPHFVSRDREIPIHALRMEGDSPNILHVWTS